MRPSALKVLSIGCFLGCLAALNGLPTSTADDPQVRQVQVDESVTDKSALAALILEGHELDSCLTAHRTDEPIRHLPPGMVLRRNPYASTDSAFVEAVSRSASMGRIPREGVLSALYASYRSENGIVILRGLEAASRLDADWREAALRNTWAHNESLNRATVHRKGMLLVVVWHLGLTPERWASLNERLAERLDVL